MTIGERIKERRKELNLTILDIANKLKKNRATIYRYENDEIYQLPVSVLEPLARVLQCTPAYLMGWGDDAESVIDSKDNSQQVTLTAHQKDVIDAYIAQPQMQPAVDRLLGVEPEQE